MAVLSTSKRTKVLTVALAVLVFLFGFVAAPALPTAQAAPVAADNCQTFAETGFQVCGKFLQYWQSHGG